MTPQGTGQAAELANGKLWGVVGRLLDWGKERLGFLLICTNGLQDSAPYQDLLGTHSRKPSPNWLK